MIVLQWLEVILERVALLLRLRIFMHIFKNNQETRRRSRQRFVPSVEYTRIGNTNEIELKQFLENVNRVSARKM